MGKIGKQVIQGLVDLGEETGKEAVKQAGQIIKGVVTGRQLVGEAKEMSQEEMAKRRAEDEEEKQRQMAELGEGRDVEAEVKQVRQKKAEEEKKKEEEFLQKLGKQREAEEEERQRMAAEMGVSSNPAKRRKKRGSAFARDKRPSQAQMSATAEFGKKPD